MLADFLVVQDIFLNIMIRNDLAEIIFAKESMFVGNLPKTIMAVMAKTISPIKFRLILGLF